jgi:competence protein ComEC
MQYCFHHPVLLWMRLVCLLLAVAVLTGCGVTDGGDALADDDSPKGTISAVGEPVVSAGHRSAVPARPLGELLQGDPSFAALFVNVGKADACILRFGETAVLIDTGSKDSVPPLITGLNALQIDKIDAVFITHSHGDHLGGLDALAANYDIPIVYSPYYSEADKDGAGKIVKRAEKLNLAHQELKAGDSVPVTSEVAFRVLGPLALNEENDNDNSLVLRFSYGGKTFLFTGDMQFSEERAILDSGAELKSDVLKVGNHGNPDATGDAFAAQIAPAVAVVSTDTAADEDSAHPRVFAALKNTAVYVTENFPLGVLVTLDNAGKLLFFNPAREPFSLKITVSADAKEQSVTLTNEDEADADLSGCILFSTETGAALRVPDGTTLRAGGILTIGAGNRLSFPGDDSPLRKKKDNTVLLFDASGTLVCKWPE